MSLTNILIVRNDRLGDAMLALPVVVALRRAYPEAALAFAASPPVAPLIECVEGIDRVISASDHDLAGFTAQLTPLRFDAALCLRPTLSNARALKQARIPLRFGTARRWYSLLFNRHLWGSRRTAGRHEADLNLDFSVKLGAVPGRQFPRINLPPESLSDDAQEIGRLIVLHPGSGGSARNWPPELFRKLGLRLIAAGWNVGVTGSMAELELCAKVAGRELLNFAGKTALPRLAALLRKARLVVAASTGPLHLADALGTPVIGLYPPVKGLTATRWGPYGGGVSLAPELPLCRKCRPGSLSACWCMEQLSVDCVFGEAMKLLDKMETTPR